jgi:hypothetical protein
MGRPSETGSFNDGDSVKSSKSARARMEKPGDTSRRQRGDDISENGSTSARPRAIDITRDLWQIADKEAQAREDKLEAERAAARKKAE